MSGTARADWKRVRALWSDVLVDAAAALRGDRAVPLLLAPLGDVSRAVAGGGAFDWQAAELALHCVRCASSLAGGCRSRARAPAAAPGHCCWNAALPDQLERAKQPRSLVLSPTH
jgi:hypothetical protein